MDHGSQSWNSPHLQDILILGKEGMCTECCIFFGPNPGMFLFLFFCTQPSVKMPFTFLKGRKNKTKHKQRKLRGSPNLKY